MLKNKIFVSIAVVAVILIVILLGAKKYFSYPEIAVTQSSVLIEPLTSLMTPSQVEYFLKSKGLSFAVKEETKLEENDPRPKFQIISWKIENYVHLGFKGSLITLFFNDRLTSTRFYPDNVVEYAEALNKSIHSTLILNGSISLEPKTELRYNKDVEEKQFFEWSDKELQFQMDEWIKSFS